MSNAPAILSIRVILLEGKELKIRNPNLVSDTKRLVAGPENLILEAVEEDVRGNPWMRFPEHRNLGLPMDKGLPNIRKAWDDAQIEVLRITSAGEEEYFSE